MTTAQNLANKIKAKKSQIAVVGMGYVGLPLALAFAKTGFQVLKLVEQAAGLVAQSRKRLTTQRTKEILDLLRGSPKAPAGIRNAHLIRLSQVGGAPPTFHLMARTRGRFSATDTAYLEKVLREEGGFQGTPVRVRFLIKRRS